MVTQWQPHFHREYTRCLTNWMDNVNLNDKIVYMLCE
jgi:hypothetical protein